MTEISDYVRILKERKIVIACREVISRVFREDPKICIERILKICAKYDVVYTFFICGITAESNYKLVEKIISNGHEIACHGYRHIRFDLLNKREIYRELKKCKEFFKKEFNYDLKGFRAPYLKSSENIIEVMRDLNFVWSSSIEGNLKPFDYTQGIVELPITFDDWQNIIKENKDRGLLLKHMFLNINDYNVFLLHPWRMGQKKFISLVEKFIKCHANKFCSMSELAEKKTGIALTGDIAEMSNLELFKRIF